MECQFPPNNGTAAPSDTIGLQPMEFQFRPNNDRRSPDTIEL